MYALIYLHRNLSNFLFELLITSKGVGEVGVVTHTATSCGLLIEGSGVENLSVIEHFSDNLKLKLVTTTCTYRFLSNKVFIIGSALLIHGPLSIPRIWQLK